ncbi:MAG: hypothetical protein PHF63_00360 [Herbinix sp.]|nr:hypothetical protein [Herbinix sp.]
MSTTNINVRWFDAYREKFESTEFRLGSDLFWMRLENGKNRNIPLRSVRWVEIKTGRNLDDIKTQVELSVRWFDGFLIEFIGKDIWFGTDNITIYTGDSHIIIPLREVRWFSQIPESHQKEILMESGN